MKNINIDKETEITEIKPYIDKKNKKLFPFTFNYVAEFNIIKVKVV